MGLFMGAHAEQKEVNDTKLHLLQPDYNGLPYGIPTKEAVKADIDRVLSFLEETMPVEVSNGRLRLGGLRPVVWAGGEMIRLLNSTHPKMNDSAIHFYPTEQRATEPIFTEKRNH